MTTEPSFEDAICGAINDNLNPDECGYCTTIRKRNDFCLAIINIMQILERRIKEGQK